MRRDLTGGFQLGVDLRQARLVEAQQGAADALAPPLGQQEGNVETGPLLSVLVDLPPHPAVTDHLPVDLRQAHVGLGVAVVQVGIVVDDIFQLVRALDPVGGLAAVDAGQHLGEILGPAEAAQDQLGQTGQPGEHQFVA